MEGPHGGDCAARDAAGAAGLGSAPAGFARLNPRPSRAVNDPAIGCMIIYWICLQSYLHTT